MEHNIYGLLGVVVVWVGTIVTVWMRTRHNGTSKQALTRTSTELSIVLGHAMDLEKAVEQLKEQHEGEAEQLKRSVESWQLRALQCEERERQRNETE